MLARSKTVGGGRNRGESDATSTRSGTRGDNFEAIGEEAPQLRESSTVNSSCLYSAKHLLIIIIFWVKRHLQLTKRDSPSLLPTVTETPGKTPTSLSPRRLVRLFHLKPKLRSSPPKRLPLPHLHSANHSTLLPTLPTKTSPLPHLCSSSLSKTSPSHLCLSRRAKKNVEQLWKRCRKRCSFRLLSLLDGLRLREGGGM